MRAYTFLKQVFSWMRQGSRSQLIYWSDVREVEMGQKFIVTHVDNTTGEIGLRSI